MSKVPASSLEDDSSQATHFSKMNRKLQLLSLGLLLLALDFGAGKPSAKEKRQSPFSWDQLIALANIQALARGGGLPEEDWKAITKYDKDVCYTPACLETAKEIMQATDFSVDPCQPNRWRDFVCRRKLDARITRNEVDSLGDKSYFDTVPLLKGEVTPTSQQGQEFLLKEAQTLYSQCVRKGNDDSQDVKDILRFTFNTYGEWPMLTGKDSGRNFDWMKMVADLNRVGKKDFKPILFKVSLDSANKAILLRLGEMGMSVPNGDFQETMNTIQTNSGLRNSRNRYNFYSMASFLGEALRASSGHSPSYRGLKIKHLQELTDQRLRQKGLNPAFVNWLAFFQRTFSGSEYKSEVYEGTNVVLDLDNMLPFVEFIAQAYKDGQTQPLADVLHFQLTTVLLQETTVLLDNLSAFKFNGDLEWECYKTITEVLGYSLGRTYLNMYYEDWKTTPGIAKLAEHIRRGYITEVKDISWMKQKTKDFLVDKIERMGAFVVQPEWIRKKNGLQNFYKGLHLSTDKSSSYPLNYLNLTSWVATKKMEHGIVKLVRQMHNETVDGFDAEWSGYLGTVNAYYAPWINHLVIQGGIAHAPLFDVDRPGFSNFGGLGMVLGHEIGHSFDTDGRKYNADGEEGEYWDPVSKAKYDDFVQRVITKYGDKAYHGSNTQVGQYNSKLTVNENIADILGVAITLQSYKLYLDDLKKEGKEELKLPGLKNFSLHKLFFMKYATTWCEKPNPRTTSSALTDVHSPGNVRAVLPLMFSPQFAETFGCQMPDQLI